MNGGKIIASRDYWSPYDELYQTMRDDYDEDDLYEQYEDYLYELNREEEIFRRMRETDGEFY